MKRTGLRPAAYRRGVRRTHKLDSRVVHRRSARLGRGLALTLAAGVVACAPRAPASPSTVAPVYRCDRGEPGCVRGRFYVVYRPQAPDSTGRTDSLANELGFPVLAGYPVLARARPTWESFAAELTSQSLATLRRHPAVEWIEEAVLAPFARPATHGPLPHARVNGLAPVYGCGDADSMCIPGRYLVAYRMQPDGRQPVILRRLRPHELRAFRREPEVLFIEQDRYGCITDPCDPDARRPGSAPQSPSTVPPN
jgi:hypothetical protein